VTEPASQERPPYTVARELGTIAAVIGIAIIAGIGLGKALPREGPARPAYVPIPPPGRFLYFAPIGEFPISDAEALVAHYRARFGLEIEILPTLPIPFDGMDAARGQVIAERLTETVRQHPVTVDQGTVIIGLTNVDMYIAKSDWRYAYSFRLQSQYAVVSSARLADEFGNPLVQMGRLQRLVTKNIGVLFYDLPLSSNPRSVLYDRILGPDDLDRMSEDFLFD
jgi:predicted Zn-dependent protease